MRRRSRSLTIRRAALLAALASLLACGAAGLLRAAPPSAAQRAAQLEQARQRWEALRPARYRLVLAAPSWCRIDAEVEREQIVRVYASSCPSSAKSVSDLFALAHALDADADTRYCAPGGCECIERRVAQIDYDPQLGYPRAIALRRQRQINWDGFWAYLLRHGLPNCLPPRASNVLTVLTLDPLS